MKERILSDPAFGPGLLVWAIAVTVLPLRLGLGGAGAAAFVAYVVLTGFLLAVADAVLNPSLYRRFGDVVLQSVFWAIGIAVPALAAFWLGAALAPAQSQFAGEVCAIGGIDGSADRDDRTDSALEDAIEALDDCEPAAS
jgi:hypothetical protein